MDSVDLNVLRSVLEWRRAGQRVVLYSVVQTWGTAPRAPGAMLALREDGVVIGSVSGGCVEDDLIARLHDGRIPADGPPVQLITYGVTREEAARFGLPCGGTLRLTEERVGDPAWVAQLLARCEAHEIVARSLDIATGEVVLQPANKSDVLSFDSHTLRAIYGPRWRLLLIGAGQLSRYVAEMARLLDFEVLICDPRRIADALLSQAQRAAARQPKPRGLLAGNAVSNQLHRRPVRRNPPVVQPRNQVVLDATAGHRADHHAVLAQRQHRARCPGRGAPGLDHAVQHHALTGAAPFEDAAQDVQIDAVHQASAFCQPCN